MMRECIRAGKTKLLVGINALTPPHATPVQSPWTGGSPTSSRADSPSPTPTRTHTSRRSPCSCSRGTSMTRTLSRSPERFSRSPAPRTPRMWPMPLRTRGPTRPSAAYGARPPRHTSCTMTSPVRIPRVYLVRVDMPAAPVFFLQGPCHRTSPGIPLLLPAPCTHKHTHIHVCVHTPAHDRCCCLVLMRT